MRTTYRGPLAAAALALGLLSAAGLALAQEAGQDAAQGNAQPAAAQQQGQQAPATLNGDVITGKMFIFFDTRKREHQESDGTPKKGVRDLYNVDLKLKTSDQSTFGFVGPIYRTPLLKGMLGTKQEAGYDYNLDIRFADRSVGKWVGLMKLDESGGQTYHLSNDQRPLRIQVTQGRSPFEDKFQGSWYGLPEQETTVMQRITRRINGRDVSLEIRPDPMKFNGIVLAKGPNPVTHPNVTVTGELTYDRETANYFAKDLTFRYKFRDKDYTDKVSGSVKWAEQGQSGNVRKGRYEFNLRFNEESVAIQNDEDMFKDVPEDDLFFAVDTRIPSLTGTIEYEDTMAGDSVVGSTVTYNLKANNLTEQQVMAFAKLWLIAVGPTNDE